MEGAITLVLAILDERMKKLDIRGGVPKKTEDYMPSSDIYALEKKWEGELKEVSAKEYGR